MKRKAIVAGNVGIDISPVFTGEKMSSMDELLRPGEIVHIEGSEIHPGGGAANTGIAMNLFGVGTTVMARIGDDYFGKMLERMMADYGAETAFVKDSDSYTAYSIILAIPGMDRVILQNPGANDRFYSGDVDMEVIRESCLFHFGHPPSMEKIYREGGRELVQLFRKMRREGLVTSLDLCAVDPASPAGREDWKVFLENVLPFVDFFLPSRSELVYMLETDGVDRSGETDGVDVEKLAEISHRMGAGSVVIKMGDAGMYYSTGSRELFHNLAEKLGLPEGSLDSWANRRGFQEAYSIEEEISGLGAGDISIAAFLSAFLKGYSFDDSLYLAAAEGALCVTAYDAFSGLMPFEEVVKDLKTR